MDKLAPLLAVVAAGLLIGLQGPSNGWVLKASDNALFTVAVSLSLGLSLVLLTALVVPLRPQAGVVRSLPWYAWLGGAYGVVIIVCAAWGTPKLGAGPALVAALVAQTAMGLALDHFGVLGLERAPISWLKVGGLAVMVAGAVMIAAKK